MTKIENEASLLEVGLRFTIQEVFIQRRLNRLSEIETGYFNDYACSVMYKTLISGGTYDFIYFNNIIMTLSDYLKLVNGGYYEKLYNMNKLIQIMNKLVQKVSADRCERTKAESDDIKNSKEKLLALPDDKYFPLEQSRWISWEDQAFKFCSYPAYSEELLKAKEKSNAIINELFAEKHIEG